MRDLNLWELYFKKINLFKNHLIMKLKKNKKLR